MSFQQAADRPWEALPPEAYPALAPHLPALAEEIIAAIRVEVPDYARPLEGGFGETVRLGVEQALVQFVEMTLHPGTGRAGGRGVYVRLGRLEMRAGRSLEALLSAYRVGARVSWRRLAAAGLDAGLAPATLVVLAEAIFAYIDELSAESAEGFAHEQAERRGELDRRRERLLELLLQEPPADGAAVTAAAEAAQWRLPAGVGVLVWRSATAGAIEGRLPVGSLASVAEGEGRAVIPDPAGPGRTDETARAVAAVPAGLGSAVPWREAARSLARARRALELAEGEVEPRLIVADHHRLELILRGDRALVGELASDVLAPLAEETDASRRRLSATLLAWLRHDGNVAAAAQELSVHAQTVRYRLNRLRELFGARLERPDDRFALELALRVGPP